MQRPVVLVVDDERSVREFLRRWLEAWGYVVQEAGTAAEALERMFAAPASIILCDIRMPGHDGLWLAERVREHWPQIAIIMATAIDDIHTVVQSRNAGAVDFVTKPFGRELLRQALNRAHARTKASLSLGDSHLRIRDERICGGAAIATKSDERCQRTQGSDTSFRHAQ